MCRSGAVLYPVDADRLLHEVDLVPLQVHQLARAQPMTICDQDRGGIAVTIAAILAGDNHQPLDLGFGEVFPWTPQPNCLTFRRGRVDLDHRYFPRLSMLANGNWHTNRRM